MCAGPSSHIHSPPVHQIEARPYYLNTNLLTHATVANWWVSGAFDPPEFDAAMLDQTIIFTNGQCVNFLASGMFSMAKPLAIVTATTGTVACDSNYNGTNVGLHYGVLTQLGGPPGINFSISNSFTLPAGFTGTNQWVQVINTFVLRYHSTNAAGDWYHWAGTNGLDTSYPYDGSTNRTEDSPGRLLRPWGNPWQVDENFSMWLEFRPDGGRWVPLRRVDWHWSGAAFLSGTNWVGTNLTNNANPPDTPTEDYARWTNLVTAADDNFVKEE